MSVAPLPAVLYEPVIRRALREDLGRGGDLTTDALVPAGTRGSGRIVAREAGCIAGIGIALAAFRLLDTDVSTAAAVHDGDAVGEGAVLASAEGPVRALLAAERTALNLLAHLSGIATATRRAVDSVAGTGVRICDTRKTAPGLRALERYAVRAGGGVNHRLGLDDAVLVKDNHLVVAGGVAEAVRRVRSRVGHTVTVEVEVERLEQVAQAIDAGAQVVLLDNLSTDDLREAVAAVAGRAVVEASGGITPATVREVAATGVDVISVGWLTHSAPALDVAFELHPGG